MCNLVHHKNAGDQECALQHSPGTLRMGASITRCTTNTTVGIIQLVVNSRVEYQATHLLIHEHHPPRPLDRLKNVAQKKKKCFGGTMVLRLPADECLQVV